MLVPVALGVLATTAVALSIGVAKSGPAASQSTHPPARQAHAAGADIEVGRMSIPQLAGTRVVYSYHGLTPPPALITRIRAGEAAGVILFGDNVAGPTQVHAVVAQLQEAAASSPVHVPLLILTDQEGGLVRRLPGPPSLSERHIGEEADGAALAAAAGRGAGANLRSVGVNVNLAPVLDVYRTRGDFIDEFQRSYGSEPALVASLGTAFISAQQRAGVAATAKHFPGLGAAEAEQNTDLAPVTLTVPLAELRRVDERPYRAAIAAGVRLVMVSWATYPALDPKLPAGLSSTVIQRELRDHLGFRGVTISDAVGSFALRRFGAPAQVGALAARAGADLLICSAPHSEEDSPSLGVGVLHTLESELRSGRMGLTTAREAATRVLTLRSDP